jgi:intracellular multiplication protein IcmP
VKNQKQGDNDLEGSMLFVGLALVILALVVWFFVGTKFSALLGALRRYELVPFAIFFQGAASLHEKLAVLNGRPLDFSNTVQMLNKTGVYVRWLYIPVMTGLAALLLNKSVRGRFQKRHTMTSLAKSEALVWPEIAPVAGKQVELVTADHSTGPWAVALTEWEFAEKHKLASRHDAKLDRDRTREVFTSQLGPRWNGPRALPKHAKALYATLLLYINGEDKEGLAQFRNMARTFAAAGVAGMDTAFADAVIARLDGHAYVRRAVRQHAYVFTLLPTLLQIARAKGVLASSMFIWLKTVDRRLWYTLNNTGRYAFHVECAGIAAHWLFEKTAGEACPSPMVEKAIDGLAMALTEYTEDDSLNRLYQ